MGQKVAEGKGLTSRQKEFLDLVLQEDYILKRFYLSGGTALSCWYLHHRKSYDLDFFSTNEVNAHYLSQWLVNNKGKLGFKTVSHTQELGFNFFVLKYPNNQTLKIDFSYFPSERIEKGIIWNGLEIDSLYDIAANKIHTIGSSPRGRDYVDFYFIIKETDWPVEKLIKDAAIKHGLHIGVLQYSKNFLRVVEFTDIPEMLIPFDKSKMEEFFLKLAKSLEGDIFK